MTSEANILQEGRLAASQEGAVLLRNNIGAYKDLKGRLIRYGVGGPGGSDLIGYKSVLITQDMVGQLIAQFAVAEAKTESGKATKEQLNFLDQVKKAGGKAGIFRNAQQMRDILK